MTVYGIYDCQEIWINDQFKGYRVSIAGNDKPKGKLYFEETGRKPIELKPDANKQLDKVKSNNDI